MNKFEKKYGIKEDKKIIAFHKSRRMFCVYQNKLFIAEPNLPYSHAVWLEKEKWITAEKDALMNNVVRGVVDSNGNIYFYVGYDFQVNEEVESILFSHLKELIEKLKLKPNAKIFGGLIKSESGKIWTPRKKYGKIKDNLSSRQP